MSNRSLHVSVFQVAGMLMFLAACPLRAERVTILSWNIYGYGSSGSGAHDALQRIVQAVDPDIILFQEATDASGRDAFFATFADELPYSYLGAPTNEFPRNQVLSAFPMTLTGQIFTEDPDGGVFSRPTIFADLDIDPHAPGAELRVYSAHHKSGSTSRDRTLKLNQAIDDIEDVNTVWTTDPDRLIFYGGDLNAWVGDPSLNKLTYPGGELVGLNRISIVDPNNLDDLTRWVSGTTIDHLFVCDVLWQNIQERYILHTETFPPGSVPPPALFNDSHEASDHLALVAVVDIAFSRIPDFDGDGDVDPDDSTAFHDCRTAPGAESIDPDCQIADIDRDDDVDQADFGYFQRCMSGRNAPYDSNCLD